VGLLTRELKGFLMPEHFRSRTDMIMWLIKHCPRPSIVRALETGNVEFLGGFTKIPPSNLPGWIFVVKDKNVCILANDLKHKYEIRIVKHIPWEYWHGMFSNLPMVWSFASGDKPQEYRRLYDEARQTSNR